MQRRRGKRRGDTIGMPQTPLILARLCPLCLCAALFVLGACNERVVVGYEPSDTTGEGRASGGEGAGAAVTGVGGSFSNGGSGGSGTLAGSSGSTRGPAGSGGAPLELPGKGGLLWDASLETGDVSEWSEGERGGSFVDNDAAYRVGREHAHTGEYALEASVRSIGNQLPQAMMLRDFQLNEGYYAAYFCVRENYDTHFWVIMKFMGDAPFGANMSSNDRFDIDLSMSDDDGQLHLQLDEHGGDALLSPLPVPIDEWFLIEAFYRSTPEADGRLVVWQDGVQVFDTGERPTAPSDSVTFGVGVAAWRVSPLPASVWIDDVAVHQVE